MPDVTIIEIMITGVTVMRPQMEMGIIVRVPIAMVSPIVVPVPGTPRVPVNRVIIPIPGGVPCDISWKKNKAAYRPESHLHRCGPDDRHLLRAPVVTSISGIGSFSFIVCINGFNDVAFTI